MTDEELDAIEARANAATAGPWEITGERNCTHIVRKNSQILILANSYGFRENNSAFVAAAREDVPRLVQEVRRLQKELADASDAWEDAAVMLRENDRLRLLAADMGKQANALKEQVEALLRLVGQEDRLANG